jgi:TonB family protein
MGLDSSYLKFRPESPASPPFVCTFICESMPEFPGGEDSLMAFIGKNCHYPIGEFDTICKRVVITQFSVDEQGRVGDIKILRRLQPAFDAEAIRVIRLLPRFKPGSQMGKPVKVYYSLPFKFKME